MGEMASAWGYEKVQHGEDEVGQQLLYATLELEKLKSEAIEEMNKNKEYANQLIHLLKSTIEERDEARAQLEKLIKSESIILFPAINLHLPLPGKAKSSITESNSLSHASSPVDSLFEPEFSNTHHFPNTNHFCSMPKLDRGSLIIDNLTKGRVLPQKGMLLQTVRQAGPLLQTLMLAGPLPTWRNPPQMQPFQIPPITIKGSDVSQFGSRLMSSSHSYNAPTMSEFGNGNCGANYMNYNGSFISSAFSSSAGSRLPKRQRFC